MKMMWTMLAAVAFSAGAALAQTTSPVVVQGTTIQTATAVSCPTITQSFPAPCAAKAVTDISGDTVVLVLGSEERYALNTLDTYNLGWRDIPSNYISLFSPDNPLTNTNQNMVVSRQGNPYFPYYRVEAAVRVAGMTERYVSFPSTLSTEYRNTLTTVADRFRNVTTQQAMAMGYQPMGACIRNVGQVYLNQSFVDNRFDTMNPEALIFNQHGRLLAVDYILRSDVPVVAFGQQMQQSPLVQGALQLPVWLYDTNRNGMFSFQDTESHCD